jgi:hypothetical protein
MGYYRLKTTLPMLPMRHLKKRSPKPNFIAEHSPKTQNQKTYEISGLGLSALFISVNKR